MKRKKSRASVQRAAGGPAGDGEQVTVENVNVPGYSSRVNGAKYRAMRSALLRVLPRREPGLTQREMFRAVRDYLPEALFPRGDKANWWAKTVQLDLEAKHIVEREAAKPLRWHRGRKK